jgi:acetyltransferase-like isoleucine patch superfamily enzyme
MGRNVKISNFADVYDCKIGDGTKIESFVYVEGGVIIGKNCKIKAHAFIPEGVTIEDGVFIGPGVIFTNDKYPRSTNPDGTVKGHNDWTLLQTHVKRGVSIGAGSVILPGLVLGEYSVVGAGSVVTKDVPPYALVRGNPAKIVGKVWDVGEIKQKVRRNL